MVELVVNGEQAALYIDPSTPLVLALRYGLGLCGVRAGCAIGECGACVVLSDGEPIRSCQTPLSAVAGAQPGSCRCGPTWTPPAPGMRRSSGAGE